MATRTREGAGALILLVAASIGCATPREQTRVAVDTAVSPAPAMPHGAAYRDTTSIAARVDSIDQYVAADSQRLGVYAVVPGNPQLVLVRDSTEWPDNTEASINVALDPSGRPLLHREMPTSESGDWFAVISHYFDPTGRTILYDYHISGFSSGCTDILRESKRIFLGRGGDTLAKRREFTDVDGRPINPDNCYRRSDEAPAPKPSAAELRFPE